MVTRKPVPDNEPIVAAEPPRIELWSATDSEVDTDRIWDEHEPVSPPTPAPAPHNQTSDAAKPGGSGTVPDPLRPGVGSISPPYEQGERNPWDNIDKGVALPLTDQPQVKYDEVPPALRPGAGRSETNPFKRKPVQPLPETSTTSQPPTEAFSQLSVDGPEPSKNPWQPAFDESTAQDVGRASSSLIDQQPDGGIWGSPKTPPVPVSTQSTGNTDAWNVIQPPLPGPAATQPSATGDLAGHGQNQETKNKGKQPVAVESGTRIDTADGWNLIDSEPVADPAPGSLSRHSTWENFVDATEDTAKDAAPPEAEEPPTLPPRHSLEAQPAPPPQLPSRRSPSNVNMAETYQIKLINWQDVKASRNPRKSPILVQNANGPCPLVALVNALTLTTPADRTTTLVEALGSREQISLSFLLDNVLDELISHRHAESDRPLPDMSELYEFLKGLHTGMNVNPRFVPTAEAVATGKRNSLPHVHPSERDGSLPGTFEKTRDMELYATFSVPLIHGWLPPRDHPVYEAMSRQASSYDDAQNILFREEELEHKFSTSETGLTGEEQQMYQDILTIKAYLATTATQLTPYGLDAVTKSIPPGGISILFRNDHFSTLYRHPQTLQLFTLVTDAGYFTHDEVVWESLVDVRGERAEFFSGDFRLVGGNQHRRADSASGNAADSNEVGWQTVQNRRAARANPQSNPTLDPTPLSPQNEQEDRDLALALQLQEEEDERHRVEQAARRRESHPSGQGVGQQGANGNRSNSVSNPGRNSGHSLPPPRVSSANQPARASAQATGVRTGQQVRSLIPPLTHRPADEALEDAPPSYEQASKTTPYVPPAGHPAHAESNPRDARRSTLSLQNTAGPSTPTRPQQRQSVPSIAASSGSTPSTTRERDCVIM